MSTKSFAGASTFIKKVNRMALLFFVTLDNLLLKGNVFRKKGPLTGWETADPFAFLTMEIKPDRPPSRVKSGYYDIQV